MRVHSSEIDNVLQDESGLLTQARQGNRQAFAVLAERYWDLVYRWLYHLSHERHVAEHVSQETFLRAFAEISSFPAEGHFKAWVLQLAYNAFLAGEHAQQGRKRRWPVDIPMRTETSSQQRMSQEAIRELARTVGRLPREFRAPLLLRAEAKLSFSEIAGVLGISRDMAIWRTYKARHKLLEVLQPFLDKATR